MYIGYLVSTGMMHYIIVTAIVVTVTVMHVVSCTCHTVAYRPIHYLLTVKS